MKKTQLQQIILEVLRRQLPAILIQIISGNSGQIKQQQVVRPVIVQQQPKKPVTQKDYTALQQNYARLQQKLQMYVSSPPQNTTLTQILNPYQPDELEDDQPILNLKNPKFTPAINQTVNDRLNNFGLQSAINDLTGQGQVAASSVLQDPNNAFMFNKDFSKILKKTDQKLKLKQGL